MTASSSGVRRLYVTPWALFSYEECPLRYHLQRSVGRKSDLVQDSRNAFNGSVVHLCWEYFVKLGLRTEDQMLALVPKVVQVLEGSMSLMWDTQYEREDAIERATQSLRNSVSLVKSAGYWYPEDMKAEYQLTPASKFEVQGRPFAVGGRIDLLVSRGSKEVVVLDWKDVRSESTINYAQLGIYQCALEARGFKVVESAFVCTQLDKFSEKLLDRRGRRAKLEQRLVQFYDGVTSESYQAKPSIYTCRWCKYKDECTEKYTHEQELRGIEESLGSDTRGELSW